MSHEARRPLGGSSRLNRPRLQVRLIPVRASDGVGSVGTRCWVILLLGRDSSDFLFLHAKGSATLRARAVPRQVRVLKPGVAGGRGPAADAGRERHHPRMAAQPNHLRGPQAARLLRSSAMGLEELGRRHCDGAVGYDPIREIVRVDARPRSRTVRRPIAIASYLGSSDAFDRFNDALPRPKPTRTSATTRHCWTP